MRLNQVVPNHQAVDLRLKQRLGHVDQFSQVTAQAEISAHGVQKLRWNMAFEAGQTLTVKSERSRQIVISYSNLG